MKHLSFTDHPYFALLLVWRAVLALFALYSVLEKPFGAMLMSLATLGFFALAGELAYKYKVQLDNDRRQRQLEREIRERRAEEARLRLEAAQAEPNAEKQRKSFGLDDDEDEAKPSAEPRPGGTQAMSAEDFDVALMDNGKPGI